MTESARPKAVAVGVDGSKAAIHAVLWAVDEAVSRDVPLRLHCAVERGDTAGTAEAAVRQARIAIEAAGKPVKIDTDIIHGPAVGSLIRASASAAMVCVGAVGLRHFQPGRVGSTAAALALSARCPVAIVRGRDDRRRPPAEGIVVEVDGSSDNGVLLGTAVAEALVRNVGIQVVLCRHTPPADTGPADGEGERRALADLDRRLARFTRRHPQLRVEAVVARGGLLEYLSDHHRSVGLVIVGAHHRPRVAELVGPVGSAVLQEVGCSLLIVNQQHL